MRILYLSPVHPLLTPGHPLPRWQTQASHVRALQQLGHEVHVCCYTPADHIQLNLMERFRCNASAALRATLSRPVDLVMLSLGADVLFPAVVSFIKRITSAPLVVLSGVSPITDGNPREHRIATLIDLVANNDPTHAQQWLALGAERAEVLPISAIDPQLHYPRTINKDIDVLFIGTVTDQRQLLFREIRRHLGKGVKLVIRHHVWEEEYAYLISRSKIVINPLRPQMPQGANLRLFEIPAFGSFQLAGFTKPEWFVAGKEIAIYRDPIDAAELVKYYLIHQQKRQQMAGRAMNRVGQEHTFAHRFRKLLSIVRGKR